MATGPNPIPTDTFTWALAVMAVAPVNATKNPITAAYFRVRIALASCRTCLSPCTRPYMARGMPNFRKRIELRKFCKDIDLWAER